MTPTQFVRHCLTNLELPIKHQAAYVYIETSKYPVGYVGVELAEVLVGEWLVLELNNQGEVADSVVENQVGIVVVIVYDDFLLTGFEASCFLSKRPDYSKW